MKSIEKEKESIKDLDELLNIIEEILEDYQKNSAAGDDELEVYHGTREDRRICEIIDRRGERLLQELYGSDHDLVKRWKATDGLWYTDRSYRQNMKLVLSNRESLLCSVKDEIENPIDLRTDVIASHNFIDFLHPIIKKESKKLFIDGHYSAAIFEAFKALNIYVKKKSGLNNKDGQKLMSEAFNENGLCLSLNSLENQSDKDEQKGFQLMYMGAMTGIRNPKAHEIFDLQDPARALKYLALASLLLTRAEEATKADS